MDQRVDPLDVQVWGACRGEGRSRVTGGEAGNANHPSARKIAPESREDLPREGMARSRRAGVRPPLGGASSAKRHRDPRLAESQPSTSRTLSSTTSDRIPFWAAID